MAKLPKPLSFVRPLIFLIRRIFWKILGASDTTGIIEEINFFPRSKPVDHRMNAIWERLNILESHVNWRLHGLPPRLLNVKLEQASLLAGSGEIEAALETFKQHCPIQPPLPELFIKIVLPLILAENEKIIEDRKKLFKILGKNFNTVGERVWLKRRFKEYKIEDKDLAKLKMRMDIIPVSIALAQAANESGWGTSRFALEGNALFGQWTWSKKGILPKEQDPDQTHKIMQFQILKASVRAYKNNLNTHNAYKEFREVRARLRQDEKQITGLDLTKYLKNYAAIGEKYVAILEDIIKNNSLTDFDKANLLPTKLKKGVAL